MMNTIRPSNPIEGDLYYDGSKIEIYTNGVWSKLNIHSHIENILNKYKVKRLQKIKRLFDIE